MRVGFLFSATFLMFWCNVTMLFALPLPSGVDFGYELSNDGTYGIKPNGAFKEFYLVEFLKEDTISTIDLELINATYIGSYTGNNKSSQGGCGDHSSDDHSTGSDNGRDSGVGNAAGKGGCGQSGHEGCGDSHSADDQSSEEFHSDSSVNASHDQKGGCGGGEEGSDHGGCGGGNSSSESSGKGGNGQKGGCGNHDGGSGGAGGPGSMSSLVLKGETPLIPIGTESKESNDFFEIASHKGSGEWVWLYDSATPTHFSVKGPKMFSIWSISSFDNDSDNRLTGDWTTFGLLTPGGKSRPGCGSLQFYMAESAPVPEPTTILLLGLGLVGVAAYKRRRDG